MASNFDFLTGEFLPFRDDAAEAERHALTAPRTCAFYARRTPEKTVKWLYPRDPEIKMPYQDRRGAETLDNQGRHSGMDCRNPEARDGNCADYIPVFRISAIHAGMTV